MSELTLSTLLGILKKSIIYIVIAAIVFAAGAYVYCKFVAVPTYQTSVALLATTSSGFANQDQDSPGTDTTDLSGIRSLIATFIDTLSTRDFAELIKEKTGLEYSAEQLKDMINIVRRSDQSLFMDVTVTCTDAKNAVVIAEAICEYCDDYLVSKFPSAYFLALEDSGSKAYQNYPNTPTTVLFVAVLGAVLIFAVAIVINVMDKAIKGEKDFSANYDIPILGNIPNFKIAAREEKK